MKKLLFILLTFTLIQSTINCSEAAKATQEKKAEVLNLSSLSTKELHEQLEKEMKVVYDLLKHFETHDCLNSTLVEAYNHLISALQIVKQIGGVMRLYLFQKEAERIKNLVDVYNYQRKHPKWEESLTGTDTKLYPEIDENPYLYPRIYSYQDDKQ